MLMLTSDLHANKPARVAPATRSQIFFMILGLEFGRAGAMASRTTCVLRQCFSLRLEFPGASAEVIESPAVLKSVAVFDRDLESDGILLIRFQNHHRAFRKLPGLFVFAVSRRM